MSVAAVTIDLKAHVCWASVDYGREKKSEIVFWVRTPDTKRSETWLLAQKSLYYKEYSVTVGVMPYLDFMAIVSGPSKLGLECFEPEFIDELSDFKRIARIEEEWMDDEACISFSDGFKQDNQRGGSQEEPPPIRHGPITPVDAAVFISNAYSRRPKKRKTAVSSAASSSSGAAAAK